MTVLAPPAPLLPPAAAAEAEAAGTCVLELLGVVPPLATPAAGVATLEDAKDDDVDGMCCFSLKISQHSTRSLAQRVNSGVDCTIPL
jgi:hypothetical protein